MHIQLLSLFCLLSFLSSFSLASPVPRGGQPKCHLVDKHTPSSSHSRPWTTATSTTTKTYGHPHTKPTTTTTATTLTTLTTVSTTASTTTSSTTTSSTTTSATPVATFIVTISSSNSTANGKYLNGDRGGLVETPNRSNATELHIDPVTKVLMTSTQSIYVQYNRFGIVQDPGFLRPLTAPAADHALVTCDQVSNMQALSCSAQLPDGKVYDVFQIRQQFDAGGGPYFLALSSNTTTNAPVTYLTTVIVSGV